MIKLNGEEIIVKRFSNNEVNVKDFKELIKENSNVIELKYENDSDLISLMFIKKRLDEFFAPCTLFIWCMPYGRMDRKLEDKLFSLKYICEFINSLYFLKVIVMEPHSDVTMEYLNNAKAVYPVKKWIPIILKEKNFTDNDCIVFPDEGAEKRYADCNLKNVCVMHKTREKYTDAVINTFLKKGEVNHNSKCLIIDDICSKGETLRNAVHELREFGVNEVYIIVAHCEKNILSNGFFEYKTPIKEVYTTTSMMNKEHPKIKYIEIDVNSYIF